MGSSPSLTCLKNSAHRLMSPSLLPARRGTGGALRFVGTAFCLPAGGRPSAIPPLPKLSASQKNRARSTTTPPGSPLKLNPLLEKLPGRRPRLGVGRRRCPCCRRNLNRRLLHPVSPVALCTRCCRSPRRLPRYRNFHFLPQPVFQLLADILILSQEHADILSALAHALAA